MAKVTTTDVERQFEQAMKDREKLDRSMGELTRLANTATANRAMLAAELNIAEGDAMVGTITQAALQKVKERADAADKEELRSAAMLRKAQTDLSVFDAAIARLTIQAREIRLKRLHDRQIELATQLRDALKALLPINDALHANFEQAREQFPWDYPDMRRRLRPWPQNAGLSDMSWHDLLFNKHSTNGGRFYDFEKAVEQLVNTDLEPLIDTIRKVGR